MSSCNYSDYLNFLAAGGVPNDPKYHPDSAYCVGVQSHVHAEKDINMLIPDEARYVHHRNVTIGRDLKTNLTTIITGHSSIGRNIVADVRIGGKIIGFDVVTVIKNENTVAAIKQRLNQD
jgi:hypothetical protein